MYKTRSAIPGGTCQTTRLLICQQFDILKNVKKRYHEIGRDGTSHLFEECGSGDVYRFEAAQSGKAVPMGAKLAWVQPDDDGEHYSVDVLDTGAGAGPAQIATEAYRGGWDRTFGAGAN